MSLKLISLQGWRAHGHEKILVNPEHISSISQNNTLSDVCLTNVQVFNQNFIVKESVEDIIRIIGKG